MEPRSSGLGAQLPHPPAVGTSRTCGHLGRPRFSCPWHVAVAEPLGGPVRAERRREKHPAGRPPPQNKYLLVVVTGFRGRTGGNSFSPGKSILVIHPKGRSAGVLFNSLKKKKKSETDSSYSRRGWGWSPQDFLAPGGQGGVGMLLKAQSAAQSPGPAPGKLGRLLPAWRVCRLLVAPCDVHSSVSACL